MPADTPHAASDPRLDGRPDARPDASGGAAHACAHAVDFAVVGAGIAGASLAWHLLQRRPAARVLLLEREAQPGQHSTGRSAAMFMESYGPPQVRALTRASRAFYQQPPAGFVPGDAPIIQPRGELYVAGPGQEALLDEAFARLAPQCPHMRRLEAAAALALVPSLRPEAVVGALHDPSGADLDVHALHQGYLRGLRQAGGHLWCDAELVAASTGTGAAAGPGTGRAPTGGDHACAWHLTLADGRHLQAGTVVNAAGAWADVVAAMLGAAPIGLVPHRRSAFTFAAPEGVDVARWPAVVGITEDWYFKPDAGRLLGSPANADPTVPHDVAPEELDIATGIWRIEQATTLQIRRPASTWAGLRSFVSDGEIVIGFDGDVPRLFWAAAQGGYGIQSAHGAGLLAASLLLGEPLPAVLQHEGVDPAAVAPGRLRGALAAPADS